VAVTALNASRVAVVQPGFDLCISACMYIRRRTHQERDAIKAARGVCVCERSEMYPNMTHTHDALKMWRQLHLRGKLLYQNSLWPGDTRMIIVRLLLCHKIPN
jgi:hypothetical protein